MGVFQFTNSKLLNVTLWVILAAIGVGFTFGTPTYFAVKDNTKKINRVEHAISIQDSLTINDILLKSDIQQLQEEQTNIKSSINSLDESVDEVKDQMVTKEDMEMYIRIIRNEN